MLKWFKLQSILHFYLTFLKMSLLFLDLFIFRVFLIFCKITISLVWSKVLLLNNIIRYIDLQFACSKCLLEKLFVHCFIILILKRLDKILWPILSEPIFTFLIFQHTLYNEQFAVLKIVASKFESKRNE